MRSSCLELSRRRVPRTRGLGASSVHLRRGAGRTDREHDAAVTVDPWRCAATAYRVVVHVAHGDALGCDAARRLGDVTSSVVASRTSGRIRAARRRSQTARLGAVRRIVPCPAAPGQASLTLPAVKMFRRVLLVLGVAGAVGAIARVRGKGELPATEGGWRELDGPEFR